MVWSPWDNRVIGNVVEGSGVADIAVGAVSVLPDSDSVEELRNCFSGNTYSTAAPTALESLAPCDATPTATDWKTGELNAIAVFLVQSAKPEEDAYKTTPVPAEQPNMPDATTAPAQPATDVPEKVDLASIAVPDKPADS